LDLSSQHGENFIHLVFDFEVSACEHFPGIGFQWLT
jgi:hypothetical protein